MLITYRCTSCHRPSLKPCLLHSRGPCQDGPSSQRYYSATLSPGTFPPWIWNQSTHRWSLGRCQIGKLLVTLYLCLHLESGLVDRDCFCCVWSSRDSKPTAGDEVNWQNYDYVMCSTYCLSLDVRGGWVHAKRGSDTARHVWRETEGGNSWQSTKLICWKISSVSKSNNGQVEGCAQCWGMRLPMVMWRDGWPQGCRLTVCWSKCSHAVISS